VIEARESVGLGVAFENMTKERASALSVVPDSMLFAQRRAIVNLAVHKRLPAVYGMSGVAEIGGLMAYSPNQQEMWRRAATYVDKILKGTKPADLPVEQPTKFELVINLKTAKQIGLTKTRKDLFREYQSARSIHSWAAVQFDSERLTLDPLYRSPHLLIGAECPAIHR
jgi:ABC-type uncharacterized transport system substrate-binding protein